MNYSTEQAARIAQIITFFLSIFKLNIIGNEEVTQIVGAILFLSATGYGWYKRYKRGDLKFSGARA